MSKATLQDFFIGDYKISQKFGANYETYKWIKDINGNPIKGHNGIDWGYGGKNGAQLLNPFPKGHEVVVTKVSFDSGGYGWYLRMWDKTQNFVVLFAHCQEILVKEWQTLKYQQLVAYGDNTGWSTGPHLHGGGYFTDADGNKLDRSNGYDGWVDLLNKDIVTWDIKNPTKPGELGAVVEDNTPLAVCLNDRKMWWDKFTAEEKAHKQTKEESAKLLVDKENADKTAQKLATANTELAENIKQLNKTIQQNNEDAKQDKANAVKTAVSQKEAELKPNLFYNLDGGKLVQYGLLKLLGFDVKPKEEVKDNG